MKYLSGFVLFFIISINIVGCAITDAAGDNVDFTDTRKIVIEPKRIELNGDLEETDWYHVMEVHTKISN